MRSLLVGGTFEEEEGRRKKEEGRRKKEEGRRKEGEGQKDFNRDACPSRLVMIIIIIKGLLTN